MWLNNNNNNLTYKNSHYVKTVLKTSLTVEE